MLTNCLIFFNLFAFLFLRFLCIKVPLFFVLFMFIFSLASLFLHVIPKFFRPALIDCSEDDFYRLLQLNSRWFSPYLNSLCTTISLLLSLFFTFSLPSLHLLLIPSPPHLHHLLTNSPPSPHLPSTTSPHHLDSFPLLSMQDETPVSSFVRMFGRHPVVAWDDMKLGEALATFRKGGWGCVCLLLFPFHALHLYCSLHFFLSLLLTPST